VKSLDQLLKLQNIDLALERLPTPSQAQDLLRERASLIAKIDENVLAQYRKLRRLGLGHVLSQVQAEACTCCLAIITTSELLQIHIGEQLQTCSNCGRILYLPS
jgi:predicted  nucleic acid-binding Zn-ribbon protein